MRCTTLNIVNIPHSALLRRSRIGDVRTGLTAPSRAPHPCPHTHANHHTCSIRRLIRRRCSAVSRISAKVNSSRSSQTISSR